MEETQPFAHNVFFTLHDRSEPARVHLVQQCHAHLACHAGILTFAAGVLSATNRDVNDRDFDVSLHIVFANRAAHDAYQEAATHHVFIEQNRSNWARVRVFDSNLQPAEPS